jgi:hypothetical protein
VITILTTRLTAATLLGVFLFAAARSAGAAPFHGDAYGYQVVLPEDWVQIPDDDVKATAAAVQNPNKNNVVVFDAAFQPVAHQVPFQYPYVIVQVIPYSSMGLRRQINEDEFPEVIKAMTGANVNEKMDTALSTEARSLVSDAELGTPRLEKEKRRFRQTSELTVAGAGKVRGTLTGHFGRQALVQVCFYAKASEWDRYAATGREIGDSFRFDPATDYSTAAAAARPTRRSNEPGVLAKVIFGTVIAAVVIAVAYALSQARKKQEAQMNVSIRRPHHDWR